MKSMDNALRHLTSNDPVMADLIVRFPAPSFTPHSNYYHELVSSIISQQLSVKAAKTIETRFKELFGGSFPSPEQILQKEIEELRSIGLSRPKANYIHDLARNIIDGSVDFSTIDTLTNDEIITELTKVKGVGQWTVHMFLMFCMGRLDVLPVGDLGIRNGVGILYEFHHVPNPEEIATVATANHWHPYESVASWYIWRSLENKS